MVLGKPSLSLLTWHPERPLMYVTSNLRHVPKQALLSRVTATQGRC